MIALLLLLMQTPATSAWTVAPLRPTVGDTIRLERAVTTPPGWRVRAGRVPSGSLAEPLGEPAVLGTGTPGDWIVRYTVVAWTPGSITLDIPPLWRLGPDGSADSIAGGSAVFRVASVIPDSVKSPAPQPALGLFRPERATPIPVVAAVMFAATALALLVTWQRRRPRHLAGGTGTGGAVATSIDAEVPDERWIRAGEPKAVAARAAHRLRRALARSIPQAHEALSTTECLAVVERVRPDAPLRDLRELLEALDWVAFATAHGLDVVPLATRARKLAREFGTNGGSR
jgi:hypothetical protein